MREGTIWKEKELQSAQISDFCRGRLLSYADTFDELAKNYGEESPAFSGEDRQSVLAEKRIRENRQIMKEHMQEMARIMTEVAGEMIRCRPMEERKKRKIVNAMRQEGIRVEGLGYLEDGEDRTEIVLTMSTLRQEKIPAEEVADMFSVLLDRRLKVSVASPYLVEREPHCFVLEEEPEFVVLTGFSRATKEGEAVSGDNYAVMEAEKGCFTVLLSDGTGSGEEAGKDSGQVLDLMEKLIGAGYGRETAMEVVNTTWFSIGEDKKHPTLDICDVDLYGGSCELRKAGGAVTFLKREGQVEALGSGSLPLGIFQRTDTTPIRRSLKDGDYLVMVSDGVVDAFGEENYERMKLFLSCLKEQNPGEIAEKLLRAAICAGEGRIQDDMTVGVIGIWQANI